MYSSRASSALALESHIALRSILKAAHNLFEMNQSADACASCAGSDCTHSGALSISGGTGVAFRKLDLHTHILPEHMPDWTQRFGYGDFIRLEHISDDKVSNSSLRCWRCVGWWCYLR